MATAPVKSQPLHNFSLPLLKWGHKNQMNSNHRYRRHSETPERHRSPPSDQDSDGGGGFKNEWEFENRRFSVGSRSAQKNRFSFASCSSLNQEAVVLVDGEREKEKVCDEVEAEESSMAKPWNLRPRKAVAKAAVEIGGVSKNGELQESLSAIPVVQQTENLPKSMRLRGFVEGHGSEKKEKRKFWIALSREEIEEDVYAMTGSKPARRPKKRPNCLMFDASSQNVFPGLYLAGVSADAYRVHDALPQSNALSEAFRNMEARFCTEGETILMSRFEKRFKKVGQM
ncbi:hypothetical protein HYC85_022961 [Camellia sinensis]|uniref:Uncharacterized protein n=1 Tax=Camellia sinensis TaxID=4442 RepID=A0A7J7GD63_CAMSI|nr:hypothetical protein HYC85_022961 [Camellia sinensis]